MYCENFNNFNGVRKQLTIRLKDNMSWMRNGESFFPSYRLCICRKRGKSTISERLHSAKNTAHAYTARISVVIDD